MRPATTADLPFVGAHWPAPQHALWIDPPEPGEIAAAHEAGQLFLWGPSDAPAGFAALTAWTPGVYGLRAIVTTRSGIGQPFLAAVLDHAFGTLQAHRLGLDVTADNVRAIAFFRAAGFVQEGRWRECWQRPDGMWTDCLFFAMLAREWRARGSPPLLPRPRLGPAFP